MTVSERENQLAPHQNSGILPRVACYLQAEMERLERYGQTMKIEVSALEIYCENIRDLLSPKEGSVYLELKTSSSQKVRCVGQTWAPIKTASDFLQQVEVSQSKRIFKNNGLNERSSRSHHIF